MPNWCHNDLEVIGERKQLQKFKKTAKSKESSEFKTDLSLANFFPEPDYDKVKVKPTYPKLSTNKTKGGFVKKESAWWDWRIQNWGTKWDIEATLVDEDAIIDVSDKTVDDGYLQYTFDSAWSPPVGALEAIAKKFPDLQFVMHYDEPGMCFRGTATAKGGEVKDQSYEY